MFLPNPLLSFVNGIGVANSSGYTQFGTSSCYGAVSVSTLSSVLDGYRVVGWGLRIRNLQAPGTATGMIEVAQVPCNGTIPGLAAIAESNITFANFIPLSIGGVSNSTAFYSLLGYPESDEFAVQELMANDLLICGKITSPDYLRFRNTDNAVTLSASRQLVDGAEQNTTGNTIAATGGGDAANCQGRTAILVRLRGFPASVTSVIDIEVIYHLEGTPTVQAVPTLESGARAEIAVNPSEMAMVVSKLARDPPARIISPMLAHARRAASGAAHGVLSSINTRLGLGAASGSLPKRLGALGGDAALYALAAKYGSVPKMLTALLTASGSKKKKQSKALVVR